MTIPDNLCLLRDAGDHEQVTSHQYDHNGWTPKFYLTSDTFTFQYTWSGRGMFEYGKKTRQRRELPSHTAFMAVYPGVYRYWYPGGPIPWVFSWVCITLGDQTERVRKMVEEVGPVHSFPPDCMLIDCLKICTRPSIPHVLNEGQRSILGYRFMMELITHFTAKTVPVRMPPVLTKSLQFIEENLTRNLSLAEICRSVGLSDTSLNTLFHKHLGATVFRYVTQRRVEKAKRTLVASDQSIKSVALGLGFSSDNYFCKVFRRQVGISPAAYRAGERMDGSVAPWARNEP